MYMANMAMQPGNMDKMQFPSGGAVMPTAGSGTGWYGDERDGFIMWLRGEFAAANAIIDSLCHHLKSVGEQGEYDGVIGSIQQRRCNWNPVLHMQQYFSVAEVFNALQQVTWRRQQNQPPQRRGGGVYEAVKGVGPGKEYKRSSGFGSRHGNGNGNGYHGQGHRVEIPVKDGHNSNVEFKSPRNVVIEVPKSDEKFELSKYNAGLNTKPQIDNNAKRVDLKSALSEGLECEVKENPNSKGYANEHLGNDVSSMDTLQQNPNILAISKTFVATETSDGKRINVVDGMRLYEELFDDSGVKKMVSLVNDLRGAGKRGQFQGKSPITIDG